jgi:hypothetical protein
MCKKGEDIMWLIIMGILLLLVGAYMIKLSCEEGHTLIIGLFLGGMALLFSIIALALGIKLL